MLQRQYNPAIRKKADTYVGDVCFDHNRSDGRCDGNGVEGHSSNKSCIGRLVANGIEPSEAHPERQSNHFCFKPKWSNGSMSDQPTLVA